MDNRAQILPGTLDLLILKAVSLGPLHGYGVLLRIGQISKGALVIEQGALYPALFRLVRKGFLKATWGISQNNQRAKFYELTRTGKRRLREETEGWNRLVAAIGSVLSARPEEVWALLLLDFGLWILHLPPRIVG
jgi:PadR family transcriptional regulator, regulatory protein PadR